MRQKESCGKKEGSVVRGVVVAVVVVAVAAAAAVLVAAVVAVVAVEVDVEVQVDRNHARAENSMHRVFVRTWKVLAVTVCQAQTKSCHHSLNPKP